MHSMATPPSVTDNPPVQGLPPMQPASDLPYRWGKVQSWLFIVGGSLGFFLNAGILMSGKSPALAVALYENVAASVLAAVAGLGLLHKKIYGLVLLDVYLLYWCVRIGAKYFRFEYTALQVLLGLSVAVLMAAYTNKRWR